MKTLMAEEAIRMLRDGERKKGKKEEEEEREREERDGENAREGKRE